VIGYNTTTNPQQIVQVEFGLNGLAYRARQLGYTYSLRNVNVDTARKDYHQLAAATAASRR